MSATKNQDQLPLGLLILRISIVLFEIPWVMDKFNDTEHTAAIYSKFYKLGEIGANASYAVGVFWALLLLAFALGFKKRISYGLVMLLHGVATVTTIPNMIPFMDGYRILFLAAIPTLGGMILLYMMRDNDTIWTVGKR